MSYTFSRRSERQSTQPAPLSAVRRRDFQFKAGKDDKIISLETEPMLLTRKFRSSRLKNDGPRHFHSLACGF